MSCGFSLPSSNIQYDIVVILCFHYFESLVPVSLSQEMTVGMVF